MGYSNRNEHRHPADYEADMYTGITTFHGLVRIYNSNHWWSRTFWVTISFAAMCLFFVQTKNLLTEFHNKPTSTMQNFQVPVDGIAFPEITICNFNPAKDSLIRSIYKDMNNDTVRYILMHYLQVENLYSNFDQEEIARLADEYDRYINTTYPANHPNKTFSIKDFFMDVGYPCETMFRECMYGGVKVNCCDHAKPIMTDLGKCFQFSEFGNTTWSSRQLISGAFYGLHIVMDIDQLDYPPVFVDNFYDAGIKFYVHPGGVLPLLGSVGSAVPPGFKGFGAVSLKNLTFLNPNHWGNCQKDYVKSDNQTIYVPNSTYTSANCETNCIMNNFFMKCNCIPLRYSGPTHDKPICDPRTLYQCINITEVQKTEQYWFKRCQCDIECRRVEYNLDMSYSAIPIVAANLSLARQYNRTQSYIEKNFLILAVFMKEIIYERYDQQKSISRTATLSDIGGNMGMFMGMSVITLGEIFVYFVKFLWGAMHKRRKEDLAQREAAIRAEADAEAADS